MRRPGGIESNRITGLEKKCTLGAANGADKLVFATGLEVGSFAYVGAAAFSASGESEARFAGPTEVQVDRDGDGTTDYAVRIADLDSADQLTATDFLWL